MGEDRGETSVPLVPPSPPLADPNEIDLEAGPGDQIQCRICLESEGIIASFLSSFLFDLSFVCSLANALVTRVDFWCHTLFTPLLVIWLLMFPRGVIDNPRR